MELYEILEIDKSSSTDDIKRAYRKLIKKYHPDKCKDPGASDKFIKIRTAYEILTDDKSRKKYDESKKSNFYDFLMIFLKKNYPSAHDYLEICLSNIYDDEKYKEDINSYRIDKLVDRVLYKFSDSPELNVNSTIFCSLKDRYLDKYLYVKIDRVTKCPIFKLISLKNNTIIFPSDGEINDIGKNGDIIVTVKIYKKKGFKFVNSDLFKKVTIKNYSDLEYFYFTHIDGSKIKIEKNMLIDGKYVIIKNMGLPVQEENKYNACNNNACNNNACNNNACNNNACNNNACNRGDLIIELKVV